MEFQEDIVLRDGSTVTLRLAADADRARLVALADQVASARAFSRFIAREPISAGTSSDPVVLVAESAGALVGAASAARDSRRSDRAEVTVSVDPSAQGLGIGTRLLEALATLALSDGVQWFDAYAEADNTRMSRVFLDSGFAVTRSLDAGVTHYELALAPSREQTARRAARSQTSAAASMRAFFEPESVAVIGANRERGKIGSELLHNIVSGGYTGRLFVVHPSATSIEGVPAFPSLDAIPEPIDLAVITVPAAQVPAVVEASITKGVRALVIISAGFGETGPEGRVREAALVDLVRRAGIRMVGPNCMGLINAHPSIRLHATFSPVPPLSGTVAMSTQSGALGLAILDYARRLHIGFSTFVSVGNKADVSSNDLIQYWAEDPNTHVILLYLESFGNPRKFSQIARRVSRTKPIVAVKAGRSAVGARAASSHTGALASSDSIVDALFHQSGVIRTTSIEELFDVATVLANQPIPRSRRVAILTNAGGPGILAADACEAQALELPLLSDGTIATLKSFLPAAAAIGNPIDILASASADEFGRSLDAVLADDRIDSVIVIFIPPMVTRGEDVAVAVQRAAAGHPDKPVLAVFISSEPAPPMLAPIPGFTFPESAAVALAHVATYGEWQRSPEGSVPDFPDVDRTEVRRVVDHVMARGGGWTTPDETQRLLGATGIPAPEGHTVHDETAAVAAADTVGYPAVLKAVGPEIVHKTELKAVRVGLDHADDVREAWRDLQGRLGAQMTGALVQPMITGGVEMLVGMVEDATFGPVIACAFGGTLTEVLADSQFRLQPITDLDAQAMIDGLRGARLLRGYRGAHPADSAALRETLLRVSTLVGLAPEIRELDINPLSVLETGVRALDARVRIGAPPTRAASRRVSY
jgi:acetyl coenzyme A synthetase (ADP forming)-like protein